MRLDTRFSRSVVHDLRFWGCVEGLGGYHEVTDAFTEFDDLNLDVTEDIISVPSPNGHNFLGILWIVRARWKILTRVSGCPLLCVIIQDVPLKRRACLTSVFWLSFDMLLLFCDFLTALCSLGCCTMLLGMSPFM